jgi:hypothetical protein
MDCRTISKLCNVNCTLSCHCIYRIQEYFGRFCIIKIIAKSEDELNAHSRYFNTIDEAYEYAISLPDNYDFRGEEIYGTKV